MYVDKLGMIWFGIIGATIDSYYEVKDFTADINIILIRSWYWIHKFYKHYAMKISYCLQYWTEGLVGTVMMMNVWPLL